jgi:hypothetical protein
MSKISWKSRATVPLREIYLLIPDSAKSHLAGQSLKARIYLQISKKESYWKLSINQLLYSICFFQFEIRGNLLFLTFQMPTYTLHIYMHVQGWLCLQTNFFTVLRIAASMFVLCNLSPSTWQGGTSTGKSGSFHNFISGQNPDHRDSERLTPGK